MLYPENDEASHFDIERCYFIGSLGQYIRFWKNAKKIFISMVKNESFKETSP